MRDGRIGRNYMAKHSIELISLDVSPTFPLHKVLDREYANLRKQEWTERSARTL